LSQTTKYQTTHKVEAVK